MLLAFYWYKKYWLISTKVQILTHAAAHAGAQQVSSHFVFCVVLKYLFPGTKISSLCSSSRPPNPMLP